MTAEGIVPFETSDEAKDALNRDMPHIAVWRGEENYDYPHYFYEDTEKTILKAWDKQDAKEQRRMERFEKSRNGVAGVNRMIVGNRLTIQPKGSAKKRNKRGKKR